MAIEKVKAYFIKYGMEERIQEFDVSSATVELAAVALHCEPQRIAKTLSFMVNGHAVLVVAAGDAKIDNSKIPVMQDGWMSVKDIRNFAKYHLVESRKAYHGSPAFFVWQGDWISSPSKKLVPQLHMASPC